VFRFANEDSADGVEREIPKCGPSIKYDDGTQIPMIICSDMNSTLDSGVYDLVTQGSLSNSHPDLGNHQYGDFTRNGMSHPFSLKSSYSTIGELPFTNYTPDFKEVIDYVWFSSNSLSVAGLLGEVDTDYMKRVPGFPNYHFPSDHLALWVEFVVKGKKERKQVEADFGQGRKGSSRQ
jgi:CCR4-NOT transcription complex subunit 6